MNHAQLHPLLLALLAYPIIYFSQDCVYSLVLQATTQIQLTASLVRALALPALTLQTVSLVVVVTTCRAVNA